MGKTKGKTNAVLPTREEGHLGRVDCIQGSRLQHEQNPMMNPAILTTFFEQCPSSELKKYRQVCKLWKNLSTERWKEHYQIMVHHKVPPPAETRSQKRWNTNRTTKDGISMEELLQLQTLAGRPQRGDSDPYKMLSKPYRNFRINCELGLTMEDKTVAKFWEVFGPSMKVLHLVRVFDRNEETVKALQKVIFKMTPSLEKLKVTFHPILFSGPVDRWMVDVPPLVGARPQKNLKSLEFLASQKTGVIHQRFSIRWKEVLDNYPNLKSLKLVGRGDQHREFSLDELLTALEQAQDLNSTFHLKHLDILDLKRAPYFDHPTVTSISMGALRPLESLKLDVGYKTKPAMLIKILQPHASTLKILHCYRAPTSDPFFDFPFGVTLDALQELRLYGTVLKNLTFLQYTPNLKILHVFQCDHDFASKSLTSFWPLNSNDLPKPDMVANAESLIDMSDINLTSLEELKGDFNLENPQSFRTLTQWLPKVKRLQVRLTRSTFPIMCERWGSTLQELYIVPTSQLDDDTITGIPRRWNRSGLQRMPAPSERTINILEMKAIRKIEMIPVERLRDAVKLSSHSVMHGFQHLKHLQCLKLYVVPEHELSKIDVDKLKEKIPEVYISPNPFTDAGFFRHQLRQKFEQYKKQQKRVKIRLEIL